MEAVKDVRHVLLIKNYALAETKITRVEVNGSEYSRSVGEEKKEGQLKVFD